MFDNLMLDAEKWRNAKCATGHDPELWFDLTKEQEAKTICRACPLVAMCAEYAITENITDGIWGGLNPADRRALTKRRWR